MAHFEHTLDEAEFLRLLMQLRGSRPFVTHDDIRDAFKATVPALIQAVLQKSTEAQLDQTIEREFAPGLAEWLRGQGLDVVPHIDDLDLGSDSPGKGSTP